jgi:hypothetical protein
MLTEGGKTMEKPAQIPPILTPEGIEEFLARRIEADKRALRFDARRLEAMEREAGCNEVGE